MSKNIIFISEQLFKERTGASNQIDSKQLVPMIKVAQDMHIHPALGTTLYKRLQNGIENSNLTSLETDLLDNYITDALVWFTMSMLPMVMGFQLFSKGFLQKSSEESTAPSRSDLELIEQKYLSMAEFYKQRLIKYLQENETNFNEYYNFQSTIDNIPPDNDAYTCPIYLGVDTDTIQYPQSCGSSGNGGGNGECGDCPITIDDTFLEGNGTTASPLNIKSSFLDSIGTGNYLPTPVVTIEKGRVFVHFVDEGFDWSSVANPEIFLFRWRNGRYRKPNSLPGTRTTKRLAGWVHPNTFNNMTKYPEGCKFFRGNHYMTDVNGVSSEYNSQLRTTEWSISSMNGGSPSPVPYKRLEIDINKYMFLSEYVSIPINKKFVDVFNVIVENNTHKYHLKNSQSSDDNSKFFRMTGNRRDRNLSVFRKQNYLCVGLAVDNPLYTTNNNRCPKVFSKLSNPFAQVFDVENFGNQKGIVDVKFSMNHNNRTFRSKSPHANSI